MRNLWRGAVAASALMTAVLVTGAPAGAATGSPPVAVGDHVSMTAGQFKAVDVLANDSDPDGDELAVCRLGALPDALFVEQDSGGLEVAAERAGTFTFTYYACDLSYLAPATVTVTVAKRPQMYLRVHKATRPGMLRVSNRSGSRIEFVVGSYKAEDPDADRIVRAHHSVLVPVRRHSVVWVAVGERYGNIRFGLIRSITLPAGVQALPDGAPPKGSAAAGMFVGRAALRWARSVS